MKHETYVISLRFHSLDLKQNLLNSEMNPLVIMLGCLFEYKYLSIIEFLYRCVNLLICIVTAQ